MFIFYYISSHTHTHIYIHKQIDTVEILYMVSFFNILETLCNWFIMCIALKCIILISHNLFQYLLIQTASHFCFCMQCCDNYFFFLKVWSPFLIFHQRGKNCILRTNDIKIQLLQSIFAKLFLWYFYISVLKPLLNLKSYTKFCQIFHYSV